MYTQNENIFWISSKKRYQISTVNLQWNRFKDNWFDGSGFKSDVSKENNFYNLLICFICFIWYIPVARPNPLNYEVTACLQQSALYSETQPLWQTLYRLREFITQARMIKENLLDYKFGRKLNVTFVTSPTKDHVIIIYVFKNEKRFFKVLFSYFNVKKGPSGNSITRNISVRPT